VEHRSREVAQAGKVGEPRLVPRPGAGDDDLRLERTRGGVERPAPRVRVPGGGADLSAEADVPEDALALRQ
jgi:hypothetical protein